MAKMFLVTNWLRLVWIVMAKKRSRVTSTSDSSNKLAKNTKSLSARNSWIVKLNAWPKNLACQLIVG